MLTGKKVLVLGLARSGKAAVELLDKLHATITINEYNTKDKIPEYDDYIQRGFEVICGGHPAELFERDFDFVVRNPGINYHKPFILRLEERHIPIYTEIELGFKVAKPQNYIAITGTNGKTTTVSLIYEILKQAHHQVHLAGNIGVPYCQIILDNNLLEEGDHDIVLEMSSFQLLNIDEFKPHIASIINLSPDHLDYMETLDEYYASKMAIYKNQTKDDYFIFNKDDELLPHYLEEYPMSSSVLTNSVNEQADVYLKDNAIYYKDQMIIPLNEIKVVGKHNIQNMMIALSVGLLCDVSIDSLHRSLASFKGVEHRLEFVREVNGVKYYNDSKGTNTDASIIALKAFDKPVILLMGGFEKGLDLSELARYNSRISTLICFGAAGKRFQQDMHHPHSYLVNHLEDALNKAYEIAKAGDVVLLSPSTSSFDEFKNYEQRGEVFKELVNQL